VAWVGSHVLPHEAAVRAWLRRWMGRQQDIDDVIQEAYCRLAALDNVKHIGSGRAYLFKTARNIVLEQARRARIVPIDNMTHMDALEYADDAPPLEQVVAGARELQRVQRLIEQLPLKCRRVFVLRRIHGMPQREIARTLGISENIVEMQAVRGLKLILKALEVEDSVQAPGEGTREHTRGRTRRR
jgi:RNA polymerase sigma factor (sigma-70 family)